MIVRRMLRIAVGLVLLIAVAFVLDQVIWAMRGSPMSQIQVSVVVAMELKGSKEDYGLPDLEMVGCARRLFPSAFGDSVPCWWIERHREVIRRI